MLITINDGETIAITGWLLATELDFPCFSDKMGSYPRKIKVFARDLNATKITTVAFLRKRSGW